MKSTFEFTLEIDGREIECRATYCYSGASRETRDEPGEAEMAEIAFIEMHAGVGGWKRVPSELEDTIFDLENLQERILEVAAQDEQSSREDAAEDRMDAERGN